jgi:outer membrane protein assembly factor BamE (lipoprotein component of BamABCDE complex)
MRLLLKLSVCVLMLSAAGCILPMTDEVSNGHRYSKEALEFLDAKGTTRADVVANLGPPILESHDTRTLIYEWEQTPRAYFIPPSDHVGPFPTESKEVHGDPGRYCLFVAYDEHGYVSTRAIRKIGVQDLEVACANWLHERGK